VFTAAFVIALVAWTDGLRGITAQPGSATGGISSGSAGPGAAVGSGSSSPGPASSSGPATALPGVEPPTHLVTLEARGDGRIGRISYVVDGHGTTRTYSEVASPFRRVFTTTRAQHVAVLSVQVGPDSQWASCSVTVDGRLVVTYTAHGAYAVVTCAA
jgi:hypothetical protein